jgi:hypothetical protein
MNAFRRSIPWLLALLAVACERSNRSRPVDTVASPGAAPPATDSTTTANRPSAWDPSAGPILLVPADSANRAFVIVPDSASRASVLSGLPRSASVALFGRNGSVQSAELPSVAEANGCQAVGLQSAPPPHAWSVGFLGGVVAPLRVDSIESSTSPDSASLAASVFRLASMLPNDTAGRFTGLPFVARGMWRFTLPNGSIVLAANVIRQINQEATPLQERTFVLAERAPSDTSFMMAYHERIYGEEETIESGDFVAAVALGANRNAAVIISRDFGDATAYSMIERDDDGHWRLRWTSARRHC